MKTHAGSCHCGNIGYELGWPTDDEPPQRECTCEFCRKHGAAYTAHPEATLRITVAAPEALVRYRFATGTAAFMLCARCGVMTGAVCDIDGHTYAVVNTRTLAQPLAAGQAARRDFGAEGLEERLARRRKTWIRTVSIDDGAAAR